jgi:predicted DsbA family dithiol-disulfide isomerase
MTRHIKVDLFTDIVCPWCLVGSARLDQTIAALPPEVHVEVENHPFYLDPDTPPEGYDVADMLRRKYHREPREMWARVEAEARASGIALDLSRQPRSFPTRKGHTLTRLARAKGTQHPLANAIAEAYFLAYRQVHDDDVLADIAAGFGFDREETIELVNDPRELQITHDLALWAAGQGIQGVPFFVFDNRFALSGCQPAETFALAFDKALTEGAAEG